MGCDRDTQESAARLLLLKFEFGFSRCCLRPSKSVSCVRCRWLQVRSNSDTPFRSGFGRGNHCFNSLLRFALRSRGWWGSLFCREAHLKRVHFSFDALLALGRSPSPPSRATWFVQSTPSYALTRPTCAYDYLTAFRVDDQTMDEGSGHSFSSSCSGSCFKSIFHDFLQNFSASPLNDSFS